MSKTEDELNKEYYELQIRTKNIQNDRKAYNEETQAQLKKHKNMIEKLQKENEQLRNDLIAQANQLTRVKSSAAQRNLLNATEEIKKLKEKIEEEEESQIKMEEDISTLQKDILDKKKKQKGANGVHERHSQFQKQIRILENRLDKANQKFNEAIARNKELRENIDSLRRERVIFDNIYRKLEKELHAKREKMANIIETANTAYEQRDIAQEELATLIQQAEREKIEFENGLKQVNESMKKFNEMNDFMKNKQNEKAELEKMNIDHKNINDDDTQQLDTLNQTKEKQNAASAFLLEKLESYEETFAKIEAATGIHDIDELVNTFKFVNDLSNDIENTEQQINEMKAELASYMGRGETADNQRKKILNELEEKLLKTEKKAAQFELEYQSNVKKLDLIKAGIESIFVTLGCNTQDYDDLLGTQGVTETNMMIYLGIIEQNINEIIQAYAFIKTEKAKQYDGDEDKEDPYVASLQNMLAVGPTHEPMHGRPRVEPPLYYDDLSDDGLSDGTNEKPLKFEEFQQRVEQMQKQDMKSKKKSKVLLSNKK